MTHYRYSEWDGKQDFPDLDRDRLLNELERNLTAAGDLPSAIWKMQREGIDAGEGKHLPGNRELYQRLEEKRQELLQRFDFAAGARAIRRQLEKIADAESLPDLPEDIARQLGALRQHTFVNPEARHALEDLLQALRTNSLEALGGSGNRPAGSGSGVTAVQKTRTARESPSLQDTFDLLSMLQKMDRLEAQLKENQRRRSLRAVDAGLVGEVLGPDMGAGIERTAELENLLAALGYLRPFDSSQDREGDTGPELTPRAIRRIGQRALEEIFTQSRQDATGQHQPNRRGAAGMRLEETRKFEFGDDFNLHLLNTVINALRREPRRPPLHLTPDDFETAKSEPMTRSATALLLDLSRSMPRHGNFQAAKRVALALAELIRTRYPADRLHVIGFSTHARRIGADGLAQMAWDTQDRHTNIQHALWLARRLLVREANATRHIILVTDGEPTAHTEGGQVFSRYPPTARTRQATLAEVRNCVAEGIELSAFIFNGPEFSRDFVEGLARSGRARLFFTTAETLGKYVLVDYARRRTRTIG